MANKTEHYGLIKPEPIDFYDIEVHNQNSDTVDGILHELETDIEKRAVNPSGAVGAVVVIGDDGNLAEGRALLDDIIPRPIRQIYLTLHAVNWSSDGEYTIQTEAIEGVNPPGDIGLALGVSAEQVEAWADAMLSIASAENGFIKLRVNGIKPAIDIPIQMEVRPW